MAYADEWFRCPDCFCQVIQTESKHTGKTIFVCRRCGLSPLVFCIDCMNLITLDEALASDCRYCELNEALIAQGGKGIYA